MKLSKISTVLTLGVGAVVLIVVYWIYYKFFHQTPEDVANKTNENNQAIKVATIENIKKTIPKNQLQKLDSTYQQVADNLYMQLDSGSKLLDSLGFGKSKAQTALDLLIQNNNGSFKALFNSNELKYIYSCFGLRTAHLFGLIPTGKQLDLISFFEAVSGTNSTIMIEVRALFKTTGLI